MIYLDNAASTHPKPVEVYRAVLQQLRENGANPGRSGHDLSMQASETVFLARQLMGMLFGASEQNIIFTKNTTEAINLALRGLLKRGDHVLVSDLEHNSVLRPLVSMKSEGIEFDIVKTSAKDKETVEHFIEALRPNTRLILCTHASNVTGQILPIRNIGHICRANNILFGVDGAQTAGIEKYNLSHDPVDFLCVPGHKGLLAPQGTGALILGKQIEMKSLILGGTGTDSLLWSQPLEFPEGYESGTLNTPGIAGLAEGVRFILRYGDTIRAHEKKLRQLFLHKISEVSGFYPIGEGEDFVGTISVVHESDHSETIAQWLNQHGICARGGYHCAALAHKKLGTEDLGALRISFGYRNTEHDVVECVEILNKYQNNRVRS